MRHPQSLATLLTSSLAAAALAASTGCHSGSGACELSDILPETLPDAHVGQNYFLQLSAKTIGPDCKGMPTFELGEDRPGHKTPLPSGLRLSTAGLLDGAPRAGGDDAFSVWATIDCKDGGAYMGMCWRRAPDRNYYLTVLPH